MTPQQLAILNALVTFAAEHIPGGLSLDERPVAQIVGQWALEGKITDDISPRESRLAVVSELRGIRQDDAKE